MWYEIIPVFGIITGVMALPMYSCYYLNQAFHGNPYRRDLGLRYNRRMFSRDRRLFGNPYKAKGLEAIPDEKL